MNNRNDSSTHSAFNHVISLLNEDSNLQKQFNDALLHAMDKVNTNFYGGSGIGYYNTNLGPAYKHGFANKEFWDVISPYTFKIKPGKKASEAVRAFFKGLTIADCGNVVGICQLAALLEVLGQKKFDTIFNDSNPLIITQYISGYINGEKNIARNFLNAVDLHANYDLGDVGNRPIKKGEMCQIGGIPYYDIKHPGGFARLYNVICAGKNAAGKDLFVGFGSLFKNKPLTEEELIEIFVHSYNVDRDARDMNVIESSTNPSLFDMDKQHVKEKLTLEEGFKQAIGFLPYEKVIPAYEDIKKHQDMSIAQIFKKYVPDDASRLSFMAHDADPGTILKKPEIIASPPPSVIRNPVPYATPSLPDERNSMPNYRDESEPEKKKHSWHCRLFHHHEKREPTEKKPSLLKRMFHHHHH